MGDPCQSAFPFFTLLLVLSQVSYTYSYENNGHNNKRDGRKPDVWELVSAQDLDLFITDDTQGSIIGCFTPRIVPNPRAKKPRLWDDEMDGPWERPEVENPKLIKYRQAARHVHGFRYAFTTTPSVLAKLNCTEEHQQGIMFFHPPKFISLKYGDKPRVDYPHKIISQGGLNHWLTHMEQPLVAEYNQWTKERYKAVLVVFLSSNMPLADQKPIYKQMRKGAKLFRDKGLSVAVSQLAYLHEGWRELMDLGDYDFDHVEDNNRHDCEGGNDIYMLIRDGEDMYSPWYQAPLKKGFDINIFMQFATDYFAGRLEPIEKRELNYKRPNIWEEQDPEEDEFEEEDDSGVYDPDLDDPEDRHKFERTRGEQEVDKEISGDLDDPASFFADPDSREEV